MRGWWGTLESVAIGALLVSGRFGQGSSGLVVWDIALAGVREQWEDGGHSSGGCRLAGRDGNKKLQEEIIDLSTTGLNNIHIFPANRFLDFHSGLTHGEFRKQNVCGGDSQNVAYLLSQVRVGSSPNDTNVPDHYRQIECFEARIWEDQGGFVEERREIW